MGRHRKLRESRLRKEVSQLKRVLAEKTVAVDFFKGAFQKVEARRQRKGESGEKASTTNPGSSVDARQPQYERMYYLALVSRADFYRSFREQQPEDEEMEVRSTFQITLEHRRRFTAELRRHGVVVTH